MHQIFYISCRGGFEIWRNGRSSGSCDGIQAHMSTFASPRVHEVVRRIPQEILVEEVSRSSTWPKRFPTDYATEDNIALYFFAEDIERFVWVLPHMNQVRSSLLLT